MEKFFWADAIADRIVNEKGNKKEFVCASGITPSGTVHMGNFREVITTDLVVRALRDKGKKVRFIYSWDDYDRFRKVPPNVPKEYEKYLGMPISDIPSPFGKGSYAEHFEKEFEKSLEIVDIEPEFIRQNTMYKKCKYASLIKTAIEKNKDIKAILDKYREEPLPEDWLPVTVYCEKCNKDIADIISIKGYNLEYECECGYKNKIDFRKLGIVKLKWRVDWPARWKYESVDFEPGGIDHSVEGGSYTTAKEIVKKVFDFTPPVYQFYEFVRLKGGSEFSSSEGNALTLDEVEQVYEPEIIRYIFVKTRPNKAFPISFDNDIIKIYEEFDALEERYYSKKLNPQDSRIYELSVLKIPKQKPERTSFRHLITVVQSGKSAELKGSAKKRAEKVSSWLDKYAGEDMKFRIQENIGVKLNKKEKEALVELGERLKKKDLTEEELFNEFYDICSKTGISNTDFFNAAYMAIIKKAKGPRLANLILTAGKERIIKLLNQIR
jgi:lysyl-tRNA synthetase class 1